MRFLVHFNRETFDITLSKVATIICGGLKDRGRTLGIRVGSNLRLRKEI